MIPRLASDKVRASPRYRECPECEFAILVNHIIPNAEAKAEGELTKHMLDAHGIITLDTPTPKHPAPQSPTSGHTQSSGTAHNRIPVKPKEMKQ